MQKRSSLEARRDRLALASTALSRIQTQTHTQERKGSGSGPGNSGGSGSSSSGKTRLLVTVAIGASGIGLVVTDDETTSHIIIKDLRKMPDNSVNPSELAGIRVGDEVEKINGEIPSNLQDAVNMLKNSKNSVTLTILRK